MWQPPQDPRTIRLDVSEFHALDHPIWRCNGYGGPRRHLWISWNFGPRGRDYWLKPWWWLRCKIMRRHQFSFWHSENWAAWICDGCNQRRIPSEADLEKFPCFGSVIIVDNTEENSE